MPEYSSRGSMSLVGSLRYRCTTDPPMQESRRHIRHVYITTTLGDFQSTHMHAWRTLLQPKLHINPSSGGHKSKPHRMPIFLIQSHSQLQCEVIIAMMEVHDVFL